MNEINKKNALKQIHDLYFFHRIDQDQYLYCGYYIPKISTIQKIGIVLVPPIGHERLRCYRESVNLARKLSFLGFHVFRFDYRGEGESSGIFEDASIESRIHDIRYVVQELRKRMQGETCCLVGFRMGCLLSLMVANELGIKNLILCEPVINLKSYTRNLIRSNIIIQQEYFGKISHNEEELRLLMKDGKSVSIYGFHLKHSFLEQIESIDEENCLRSYCGKSLIVYFSRKESPPNQKLKDYINIIGEKSSINTICLVTDFTWATKKNWAPNFENFEKEIFNWLSENNLVSITL